MLYFENRYLQLKHLCFSIYREVLAKNPNLTSNIGTPDEAFHTFLDEISNEIEGEKRTALIYEEESDILRSIIKDLSKNGNYGF